MSHDDLPITIRLSEISDHLNCPVCMCQLRSTTTTPCGHRYCEPCIRECVDRHHKCPVCNNPLRTKQLIKDPLFDDLIGKINAEKDTSETNYFDTLIRTAGQGATASGGAAEVPTFSPVEMVLKKHLKASLIVHERYYQELKKEFEKRLEQIQHDHTRKVEDLYSLGSSAVDVENELTRLREEKEQQQADTAVDMERCTELIAQAYDRHLTAHIPNLSVLPVRVTLNILNKNVQIEDVEIKPHDTLDDIRKLLLEHMEAKGDRVVKMSPDLKFLIFGPFARRSQYEMVSMACDVAEHGAMHSDIAVIAERARPVLELNMKSGSQLAVYGQLQCESDLPKQCFKTVFNPDNPQPVDYFCCTDCRINWVCRSCMEVCHREHSVTPYVMAHKPSWACCYCPKKKKCVIQEK